MRGRLPSLRVRLALAGLAVLAAASPPAAQTAARGAELRDAAELLLAERQRAREAELLAEIGTPEARPLRRMPSPDPTVRALEERDLAARALADSAYAAELRARADSLARYGPAFDTLVWAKTPPSRQDGFLADYGETLWRAADARSFATFDTLETLEVRARLTQLFGTPTRNATAAAQERYAGSDDVQFEYWLVVNDTIPVLLLDLRGPFGRGVLFATDEAYLPSVRVLKRDLDARLMAVPATVPFVDYYLHPEERRWYKTGFDGEAFFTRRVRTPRWARRLSGTKWKIYR